MLRLKLLNFPGVLLSDALQISRMARDRIGQFFPGFIETLLQIAFTPGMLRLKLLNFPGVLLSDALQINRMAREGIG
ncbi:hypothetical protein JDS42_24580 [Escherichia coli]|nr:hypothetical protein [Escherichia coli]